MEFEKTTKKGVKQGLGDGERVTNKHREKNETLRKLKRDRALVRLRTGVNTTANNNSTFQQNMKEYLSRPSLEKLHHLLQTATEDELVKNMAILLQRQVVDNGQVRSSVLLTLVTQLAQPNEKQGMLALACLINITAARIPGEEVDYARILIEQGRVLDTKGVLMAHLLEDTVAALDVWKLIVNLINVCGDARDAILKSAIFNGPFLAELNRGRPLFRRVIVAVLVSCIESGTSLPSRNFLASIWQYLVSLIQMVLPSPKRLDHDDEDEFSCIVNDLCSAFHFLALKCQDEDDFKFLTLTLISPWTLDHKVLSFLMQLIPRVDVVNRARIAFFLVKASALEMPEQVPPLLLMTEMRKANGLAIMHGLAQNANERLQRQGIKWIANYCAESLDYIADVLDAKVLGTIIHLLRGGAKYALLNPIMYLIMAACNTCVRHLPDKRAAGYLAAIVNDLMVLKTTVTLITAVADVQLLCDILDLWQDLLKWEPHYVANELESYGVEGKMNLLLEHKSRDVFDRAERVLNTIENVNGGGEEPMMIEPQHFSF